MATAKKNKKTTKKPAPKNSQKKSKNNLLVKYYNKYPTRFVLAVVLFIFVGFYIVNQELPKVQEKRDLVEKHQKLEEIADKITAIYPTNDRLSEKYCEYSSAKFEKGDLSCSVEIRTKIKIGSIEEANRKKDKIVDVLGLQLKQSGYPDSIKKDFDINAKNSFFAELLNNKNCLIGFSIDSEDKSILNVGINCTTFFANAEHFPVKK